MFIIYVMKEFMNKDTIEKVTHIFESRVGLLSFAGNYSNDKKYMIYIGSVNGWSD